MRSVYLGPYRIERLIGTGGQGSVYLASDKRLGRRVAIKLYRVPDQQQARQGLIKEAQTLASIDHPRVVKIHDIVVARKHLALVTEYVPGCDLATVMEHELLSLPSVLAIAVDVAAALTAARRHLIVHRDVKPANILVTVDGHLKLSDFGIAADCVGPNTVPDRRGSSECLAPEQLAGESLSERTDLFALGVLMYRLLSGCHPFYTDGQLDPDRLLSGSFESIQIACQHQHVLPTGLPGLVDSLLSRQPVDRPASIFEVRKRLVEIWSELPVAVTSNLAEEAAPWFRERTQDLALVDLPEDLRRFGRSRLGPFRWREPWSWWNLSLRRNPGVVVTIVALLLALLLATRWWLALPVDQLLISRPTVDSGGFSLPEGISSQWLLQQVTLSIEKQVPLLRPVLASELQEQFHVAADGSSQSTLAHIEQQLELNLSCSRSLCLLRARWRDSEQSRSAQAVLVPAMDVEAWSETVDTLLAGLFLSLEEY